MSSYNATHSGYPTVEMKNDAKHLRKLTDTKQYLHTLGKEFGKLVNFSEAFSRPKISIVRTQPPLSGNNKLN